MPSTMMGSLAAPRSDQQYYQYYRQQQQQQQQQQHPFDDHDHDHDPHHQCAQNEEKKAREDERQRDGRQHLLLPPALLADAVRTAASSSLAVLAAAPPRARAPPPPAPAAGAVLEYSGDYRIGSLEYWAYKNESNLYDRAAATRTVLARKLLLAAEQEESRFLVSLRHRQAEQQQEGEEQDDDEEDDDDDDQEDDEQEEDEDEEEQKHHHHQEEEGRGGSYVSSLLPRTGASHHHQQQAQLELLFDEEERPRTGGEGGGATIVLCSKRKSTISQQQPAIDYYEALYRHVRPLHSPAISPPVPSATRPFLGGGGGGGVSPPAAAAPPPPLPSPPSAAVVPPAAVAPLLNQEERQGGGRASSAARGLAASSTTTAVLSSSSPPPPPPSLGGNNKKMMNKFFSPPSLQGYHQQKHKLVLTQQEEQVKILKLPVEKLHPQTGQVLESFSSGMTALDSIPGGGNSYTFVLALVGARASRRTGGRDPHIYKGFYWRIHGNDEDVPLESLSVPDLLRRPVERLDIATGRVVETYATGYKAYQHSLLVLGGAGRGGGSQHRDHCQQHADYSTFYMVLMGLSLGGRRNAQGQMKNPPRTYKGSFWRVQGTDYSPLVDKNIPHDDDDDDDAAAPRGATEQEAMPRRTHYSDNDTSRPTTLPTATTAATPFTSTTHPTIGATTPTAWSGRAGTTAITFTADIPVATFAGDSKWKNDNHNHNHNNKISKDMRRSMEVEEAIINYNNSRKMKPSEHQNTKYHRPSPFSSSSPSSLDDQRTEQQQLLLASNASSPAGSAAVLGVHYLPEGYVPTDDDILCGRGKLYNKHPANMKFSVAIRASLRRYVDAPRRADKSVVVSTVVSELQDQGHRFMKQDQARKRWLTLGEDATHEKAGHAIRDLLKAIKRPPIRTKSKVKRKAVQTQTQQQQHKHVRPPPHSTPRERSMFYY